MRNLRGISKWIVISGLLSAIIGFSVPARAETIKLLAAGATKSLLTGINAKFTAETGHQIVMANDTAGGVSKRIEAGENFDVIISSRTQLDGLIAKGKLPQGSRIDIASSVIGVAVKEGAPAPDLSSVDAFKRMLLNAKTVAYVDPASGGTSGIYIAGVIDKMGLTEAMKPKLRLQAGGYVAELVAKGEAEIAIHQISEILPVKGVTLVGELPAAIQSVTVYSGALPEGASAAARAYLAYVTGPPSATFIAKAGLKPPGGS